MVAVSVAALTSTALAAPVSIGTHPVVDAVVRPVAAQPEPFGGTVPGNIRDDQGMLPRTNNAPGSAPIMSVARPRTNATQARSGVTPAVVPLPAAAPLAKNATAPAPKKANIFQLRVVALVVVSTLLAVVSVRRVIRGG